MKALKRIMAMLIVSLTIATTIPTELINTTLIVEAHSGRTDSSGGHHDYKNKSGLGNYHYHCGGHPAHLHKNGICPYAGVANTNSSTSSNASGNVIISDTTSNTNQNSNNNNIQQSIDNTSNTVTSTVQISDTSYDNVAFNASYYANKHKDVYDIYGDNAKALYEHFILSGIVEGRQSSAQFNILVYKENNQDLVEAFGDDLIKYYNHFVECGYNENRISN